MIRRLNQLVLDAIYIYITWNRNSMTSKSMHDLITLIGKSNGCKNKRE